MSTDVPYRPRLISEVVRLHIDYYASQWGFGLPFEAKVASELSDFVSDFRPGMDFMANDWKGAELVGTISLEGPIEAQPLAHLRWFIVAPSQAGKGLGKKLIQQAMEHARDKQFPGIFLTTFSGLEPARKLYEGFGFSLVEEVETDQWSGGVREQRFEIHF